MWTKMTAGCEDQARGARVRVVRRPEHRERHRLTHETSEGPVGREECWKTACKRRLLKCCQHPVLGR